MMHVEGEEMYVEMGNDVGRANKKVLFVNAPVWGEGEIVTYLYSWGLPCQSANGSRV
jgi:hypothetical protein